MLMDTSLQRAVEKMHGCRATYISSVVVDEEFEGAPAWQGIVDVFKLEGHPEAKMCYAWKYVEDGVNKFVAVLRIDPVDSPRAAVKAAIARKARE